LLHTTAAEHMIERDARMDWPALRCAREQCAALRTSARFTLQVRLLGIGGPLGVCQRHAHRRSALHALRAHGGRVGSCRGLPLPPARPRVRALSVTVCAAFRSQWPTVSVRARARARGAFVCKSEQRCKTKMRHKARLLARLFSIARRCAGLRAGVVGLA
jgi:hypothetical protein